MRGMNSETVDLVYLDPPFNSDAEYTDSNSFNDIWTKENLTKWRMLDGIEASVELLQENPWWEFLDVLKQRHSERLYYYLSFMGIRIVQMYDILKPTGTLYLHCDDTSNSYLRMILDFVFGYKNGPGKGREGAEITWKRSNPKNNTAKNYGRCADTIYQYVKGNQVYNQQYTDLDSDYVSKNYRNYDKNGCYRKLPLSAGYKTKHQEKWRGFTPPPNGWIHSLEKREEMVESDLIDFPTLSNGAHDYAKRPNYKKYLSDSKGTPVTNLWTDINIVSKKHRKGWETQKPPALLERIIKTSSNPGDIVFDPFAGCGTTLVAAIKTGRRFVGCDIDETLVHETMKQWFTDTKDNYLDDLLRKTEYIVSSEPPKATRKQLQLDFSETNIKTVRINNLRRKFGPKLYLAADGRCQGKNCTKEKLNFMPFDMLEIDHMQPISNGGSNEYDNLQLLCRNCNASKGNRSLEEWNETFV